MGAGPRFRVPVHLLKASAKSIGRETRRLINVIIASDHCSFITRDLFFFFLRLFNDLKKFCLYDYLTIIGVELDRQLNGSRNYELYVLHVEIC